LVRPCGRTLRLPAPRLCPSLGKFQSSSGPAAGRYEAVVILEAHPIGVSILVRPCGRTLRLGERRGQLPFRSFNPRPALRPDATRIAAFTLSRSQLFQSSSGHAAGRYIPLGGLPCLTVKFQSSSGTAAGRYTGRAASLPGL